MRKCPGCGQNCQDNDVFCEACGTRLDAGYEPPHDMSHDTADHDSEGKAGRGKSPVPVIVGCVVAAAVIIAVTVGCVTVLNGKKEDAAAVVSKEELKENTGENEPDQESEKEDEKEDSGEKDQEEQEENAEQTGKSADEEDKALPGSAEEEINLPRAMEEDQTESTEEAVEEAETDSEEDSGSEVKYETYYVVNCNESITLRKSPSTKAGEICQIPFGAAVSFVETSENGFYKIIYNGKTGYGLASYLDTAPQDQPTGDASSDQTDDSSAVYMKVVNCHESITLRKIPSTKGEEFCQIPLGSKVEYLGTAENGFYMVSYNGYTGYALASYLTEW